MVIERSLDMKLGDQAIRVATVEDLILLKMVANRSIDRRDIEELREIYEGLLDEAYLRKQRAKLKRRGLSANSFETQ